MTNTIVIYGHSDDLVYVAGQVPGCNEYGSFNKPKFVELSNGLAFNVEYDDTGVWRVRQIQTGGSLTDGTKIDRVECPVPDGDNYSDRVTVTGPFEWVEVWSNWPATREDYLEKIEDGLLENGSLVGDLTDDDVQDLLRVANRIRRR